MKILDVTHAPWVIAGGRTAVRVVAIGTGRLRVGDVVVWVWRKIDRVFAVRVDRPLRIAVWGEQRTLVLRVLDSAPTTVEVHTHPHVAARAFVLPRIALTPPQQVPALLRRPQVGRVRLPQPLHRPWGVNNEIHDSVGDRP